MNTYLIFQIVFAFPCFTPMILYCEISYLVSCGRLANSCSTILSSANVEVSPTFLSLIAILRRTLRIILPERVFGKPAEPGFMGVAPGKGVITWPPVSVCQKVSTIEHLSLPILR
uniref:Uncharacterized protein n=1 Tax=Glossina palpalis gambiensis TaxID=67801 RepID=A0A1B0B577_9MUSC